MAYLAAHCPISSARMNKTLGRLLICPKDRDSAASNRQYISSRPIIIQELHDKLTSQLRITIEEF